MLSYREEISDWAARGGVVEGSVATVDADAELRCENAGLSTFS
jgi:hypothetical protein